MPQTMIFDSNSTLSKYILPSLEPILVVLSSKTFYMLSLMYDILAHLKMQITFNVSFNIISIKRKHVRENGVTYAELV